MKCYRLIKNGGHNLQKNENLIKNTAMGMIMCTKQSIG